MSIKAPAVDTLNSQNTGRRAFNETSDPRAYVPRDDTESALSELAAWAQGDGEGSTVGVLIGPPGLGKTFLLRVFESRVARESLYLPYAGLPPVELIAWIYGLLGRSRAVDVDLENPEAESGQQLGPLLDLASDRQSPFFLIIDDADSMPADTLRMFVEELPPEGSSLRILMAMNEDAKSSRLLAGLDSLRPYVVRIQSAMTETETAHYVHARLAWAGASPAELARLDAESTRRIFALSGGVPQAVHRIAGALFAGDGMALPSDLDAKQRRENWMGRPFEDDPVEPES